MARLFLFAALVSLSSTAAAQDAAGVADAEARGLFTAGEAAYAAGRFQDAYDYFRHAYDLSHRPELLYNLGLAAASAGHEREAVEAFERYLAEVPDAPNRVIVEARLESMRAELAEEEEMQARLAEAEAERARHAEAERARSASSNAGLRDAGWGLFVAGASLGVIGGVLYGVGVADVVSVEGAAEGTPWPQLSDAANRAPILTGIGATAGLAGVAMLAVGLGLALGTGDPPAETAAPTATVIPVADPSGGGHVMVVGTF